MSNLSNIHTNCEHINIVGLINHEVSRNIIILIESQLKILNLAQNTISKVKLIAVEILENICKHQNREIAQLPEFSIKKHNNQLIIFASNQVDSFSYPILKNKLNEITSLSMDGINKLYLNQLANGELSEKGNAGLGLLTLAKRSNNKFKHNFINKNNITIFTLEITLDQYGNN